MIKRFLVLVLAAGAFAVANAAPVSESSAAGLKGSQTITLAADEDGNYVYYFKATLKRSMAYTVYTTGLGSETNITLDIYAKDASKDSESEPSATFDEIAESGGNIRQVMYADSWYIDEDDPDESDPASWTYYFAFLGDGPTTFTVYFSTGVQVPTGREENPFSISPGKSPATKQTNLEMDGEYYFRARLTEGRLYRFGTSGGTSNEVLSLTFIPQEGEYTLYDDPVYADKAFNAGCYITPAATESYLIVVSGAGDDENAPFGLTYQMVDARAISAHPSEPLSVGDAATFTAGYKSNTFANQAYDEIIDESLFKIRGGKGDRFVAYTTDAQTNLLLRVYDKNGKMLHENKGDGYGLNVRCAFETTEVSDYYVGVCQDIADEFTTAPANTTATIHLESVVVADGSPDEWDTRDDAVSGASGLVAIPGTSSDAPESVDVDGHGWHVLNVADWKDTFVVAARKGITYAFSVSVEDPSAVVNTLKAEVFTLSGSSERSVSTVGNINPGAAAPLAFAATANTAYYIRLSVAEGQGLDYPNYKVHAMAYVASGAGLGILTVNTPGAPTATWSIGSESAKYPNGSSVLLSGEQKIKLSTVNGYKAVVATTNVTIIPGKVPTVVDVYYYDTSDPKDDNAKGATGLTFKNVDTDYASRTLWSDDPEDNFSFTGTDGYYYDLALKNVEGDDVTFSITNAETGVLVENVKSVRQLTLPKLKSKYFLTVKNGAGATAFGGYTLSGKFANVGAIKFEKAALSVKEDAATAVVKVKRTAKDGYVRVKYGTVAGTATPGVDYVAQNGVLEWANGDNKDKQITVKLIPDLVPVYEGNKTFSLQLKVFDAEERSTSEYPASILGGDTCTVTLTETSKPGTTAADAYAKKAPKLATVKTEEVPLETGTYYGVLAEDGSALTNGMPQLAAVTFTANDKTPAALSAKVTLAGKRYSFSDKGWDDDADEGFCKKTFYLAQKVKAIDEETGKSVSVTVTNTLTVSVAAGATATAGDWLKAGGTVELVMNVPDSNNKGYQEEIFYSGSLYRNNAKLQDYLTAVTNFTGYYTVALVPEGVSASDGIPAGNGYLTLTIDNKGTVKAAGLLADGTKISLSVAACALKEDDTSANGYSMYIPLFFAKSPAVFGGTLRLYANDEGVVVVDSSEALVWNNDNAKLTYSGEEGYRIAIDPVGGWYDTVINLQTYYLNYLFEVGTEDITEFPAETIASGFQVVTDVQPNATAVDLSGNVFSTAKKALVKSGTLYDLVNSVNPCNVQVKFARATGLVTGSFSLWSEKEDGSAQKEITGIKHNGVLLLARDVLAPLSDDVMAAGFCTKAVKVTDENEETGKKTTRNWTFSLPFNLVGVDQGDINWWADDWGEEPVFGD